MQVVGRRRLWIVAALFCIVMGSVVRMWWTLPDEPASRQTRFVAGHDDDGQTQPMPPPIKIDKEIQEKQLNRLLELCRVSREKDDKCHGMSDPEFIKFVETLNEQNPSGDPVSVSSWRHFCRTLENHFAPVCMAAAYIAVPFPLEPLVNSSDCSKREQRQSHIKAEGLHFTPLAVETNPNGGKFCTLVRSAMANDISFEVLGQHLNRGVAPSAKMRLYRDRLLKIPKAERNRTVVLAVDFRDVMIQATKSAILQKFLESDSRLLFNGESYCFPMAWFPNNMGRFQSRPFHEKYRENHICKNLFPQGRNPNVPSYLNSGAFLGYADAILEALEPAQRLPNWFFDTFPGTDQGYFQQIYLSQYVRRMKVDFCQRVFVAQGFPKPEHELLPKVKTVNYLEMYAYGTLAPQWNAYFLSRTDSQQVESGEVESGTLRVWRNKRNGAMIPILHFNGGTYKHRVPGFCSPMEMMEESLYSQTFLSRMRNSPIAGQLTRCWLSPLECGIDGNEELSEEDFSRENSSVTFFAIYDRTREWSRIAKADEGLHRRFALGSHAAVQAFGDSERDKFFGVAGADTTLDKTRHDYPVYALVMQIGAFVAVCLMASLYAFCCFRCGYSSWCRSHIPKFN